VAKIVVHYFALLILCSFPLSVLQNVLGQTGGQKMDFTISSTAFQNGGDIPKKFTCDGADVSPQLAWRGTPPKTQSLALIADDPDAPAGTWTHWVLYDLPANIPELQENVNKVDSLDNEARQGRNDFRKLGYGGPCPPPGKAHRYYFKVYALDAKLNLAPGASKEEVERRMQGHVLAKAELMGKYSR
jgi:Raf kinase inhibitor-like YbhB/YbcL family protein